tara:strand:+ start:94855 stop:95709 length:855 start_codon:yes stop_codon:yes gene_type:complete
MKPQHILLPTDFSANAQNAIDYAIYLFEEIECTFHILNSFEINAPGHIATNKTKKPSLAHTLAHESQQNIQQIVSQLMANNKNPLHGFNGISISDSLINAIGSTTINKDVDYIFMGTKGYSAAKEVFMGSNTIKVLKHINFCPIIAVPEGYYYALPDKIAFATNFEHEYKKVELMPLTELAKLWNSKIDIIHINKGKKLIQEQERYKKLLNERFFELSHKFIEIEGHSKISDAIMSYTKDHKAVGMIAMVNYWHSFFEKLIKENVIKRVAFYTEVPFLVFPLID